MAVSHVFTNAVADATGTMTIWYGATTVTVAATDVVRPSDWNSAHYQFMSATGNTAGQSTFSGTNIVFGGGPNVTLSGVNATRIDISAAAGGGGAVVSNAIQSVGSATGSGTNTSRFAADDHVHAGVFSIGVSTGGNTAGDTRVDVGRFVFAGVNAVSLSQGTAANALNTVSVVGPASATTISAVASANTVGTRGSRFALEDHQHEGVFSAGVSTGGNTSGDTRVGAGRFVFAGGNNITLSQGTAANALNTITISAASQTNQTGGIYVTAQSTGQSSSSTYDVRTLSIIPDGIISAGWSNGSFRISATQSNQAFSAAGGASNFQTLSFSDNANASFTNNAGQLAITSLRASLYATSNTTQSSSGTQNLNSLQFAGAGIASVGVTNGSVVISVPAGGGAGDGGVFAGVSTGGNTAGSTGTVSTGNFVLVGSNGITLSQSTAAAGSHATVSIIGLAPISKWRNFAEPLRVETLNTAQRNSLVSVRPMDIAALLSASEIRFGISLAVGTAANNSTAFFDLSASAVIYTRTGSTLSSIASGSVSLTQTWSSNNTGSAGRAFAISFNQTNLFVPNEYFVALHVSTNNTATGGANTTAQPNTVSMLLAGTAPQNVLNMPDVGAAGGIASNGMAVGMGMISTGATRASIALSDVTVTGTRGANAPVMVELRNYTV